MLTEKREVCVPNLRHVNVIMQLMVSCTSGEGTGCYD